MNLNIFSRVISKSARAPTQHKIYNYFKNTPHFVFMDFGVPHISRTLQFPNVNRITLVKSSHSSIANMIGTNVFPNLSCVREIVDIFTPPKTVDTTEENLTNMTKFLNHAVDHEITYIDYNNSQHLDIKKITSNFSGIDVGEISNKLYTQYLTEYMQATYADYMKVIDSIQSEDTHLLQEAEELQLQRQRVIAENRRDELC